MSGLAGALGFAINIYMWMIIIRAVISWVSPSPYNPVVKFLARATDPVLYHVRRMFPVSFGGIDFSPVILILCLVFLNDFAVNSLRWLALGKPASGVLPIFIVSAIRLVQGILFAYMIVVIARAVISWISPDPYNPIVRFIYGATEPVMYRMRSMLPLVFGGVDLTPIVLLAAIYFANSLLDRVMYWAVSAF